MHSRRRVAALARVLLVVGSEAEARRDYRGLLNRFGFARVRVECFEIHILPLTARGDMYLTIVVWWM